MLADWIVMPRSRSAGKKSVVVLPLSTLPGVFKYEELNRIDSVKVVFPESKAQFTLSKITSLQDLTNMRYDGHVSNF